MYNRPTNRSQNRYGRRSYGGYGGGRRSYRNEPQGLNPMMFVRKAEDQAPQEAYVPTNTFADFDIDPQLKKNIITRIGTP